ncbi:MAG: TIGR00366 family protein, partial [Pseudomonadota bacterium]|nr:TIGR00366 family protein [Pseudomonadota bacterium]
MLNRASKPFVKLVERYLPDPYIFVLLLTLITFAFAVVIQNQSPLTTIQQWGDGFWGLLTFSMQMLLVLVTGFMLACTPLVKALLERLASLAKSPGSAIVLVTLVSLIASWINWGFGLVVGALFAKALARKVSVDYRLLVASAYSGFIVWHGGLAGSVPLTIATPGHFSEAQIGVVGTGETIFSGFNLLLLAIMFVIIPLVNRLMLPPESESIIVDSAKLKDDALPSATNERPADKLENSKVLGLLVGFAGLAYLTNYFVSGGGLNLNIVNTLFLFLAIVLHGTPRNVLHSLQQA